MASIAINDVKNGMSLVIDGTLMQVVEFQHVKPGKGGAFVRFKLKGIVTGKVIDHTVRAGTKMERADVTTQPIAVNTAPGTS